MSMRELLLSIAIAAPMALLPGVSSAKGCLKGAPSAGLWVMWRVIMPCWAPRQGVSSAIIALK
jgi:hypothetical protein